MGIGQGKVENSMYDLLSERLKNLQRRLKDLQLQDVKGIDTRMSQALILARMEELTLVINKILEQREKGATNVDSRLR